jgi:hypothetical protein
MERLLQTVMYVSWALWLAYSYVVLFSKKQKPGHAFFGMVFSFACPSFW